MYESFLKELSNKTNPTQTLLFPLKLEFDKEELRQLKTIKNSLMHLGFEFKAFKGNSIEISGVHPLLNKANTDKLFKDFLNF